MKRLLPLAGLALLSGCFTTTPRPVKSWTIGYAADGASAASPSPSAAEGAPRGSVRVASVSVRAPYDAKTIAVLRADGSVAFDPYNQFAAVPSALFKGAFVDAFRAPGAFRSAVAASSALAADLSAEATVTRLALDCREEGRRTAVVELSVLLLKGRVLYAAAQGAGAADAADGDYSKAFSQAFTQAAADALKKL